MTLDVIEMLLNSDLPYQHKLRIIYELCNKQIKEYIRFWRNTKRREKQNRKWLYWG